ncbi:tetratricopeptide repeat protein [Aurantibacillus circumpalustris]|uniref:tetratricopeptide repeat protein n=1 Tax=Aurantibacillus circumpalustris TaxID=3036359 RepID=UPI00295C171B|nr:tetratricopeptide repeat protein [Aurantibacillus circumpalustris]
MGSKKKQLLLVLGALVLFVLLFIAPKLAPKNSEKTGLDQNSEKAKVSTDGNLSVYLNLATKNVSLDQKGNIDKLLAEKNYDSLAFTWTKLKRPDLAAHYAEELAKVKNTSDTWFNAGNRYYYSVQFIQDKSEVPVLYQCAMRCYNNGLKLDPKNTDAKIMLASCYVEGTQNPMEGVSRLKEIEKTDSNNVKLQLTFAFFSVKSQQLDKAINRFKKILQIDSTYIEAYLHLADAYEQRGETENTILVLEKYSSKTNDVTAQIEINKYIKQLKENKH